MPLTNGREISRRVQRRAERALQRLARNGRVVDVTHASVHYDPTGMSADRDIVCVADVRSLRDSAPIQIGLHLDGDGIKPMQPGCRFVDLGVIAVAPTVAADVNLTRDSVHLTGAAALELWEAIRDDVADQLADSPRATDRILANALRGYADQRHAAPAASTQTPTGATVISIATRRPIDVHQPVA